MTAAGAPIKAGGPSNFAAVMSALRARVFCFQRNKIGSSTAASRCSGFASAALTAAPPTVVEASSSNGRGEKEQVMSMVQSIGGASARVTDRVMAALISGLEIEFGRGAGEALAHRFLEAEEVDFHWDARVEERWIGAYAGTEDEEFELDRVGIFGRLDGKWFAAVMIVDGDGNAHGMMGKRTFGRERDARRAFARA